MGIRSSDRRSDPELDWRYWHIRAKRAFRAASRETNADRKAKLKEAGRKATAERDRLMTENDKLVREANKAEPTNQGDR